MSITCRLQPYVVSYCEFTCLASWHGLIILLFLLYSYSLSTSAVGARICNSWLRMVVRLLVHMLFRSRPCGSVCYVTLLRHMRVYVSRCSWASHCSCNWYLAKHCSMHNNSGSLYNILKKASSSVESLGINCALVYVIVLVLSVPSCV
jgi:hypothetical protein